MSCHWRPKDQTPHLTCHYGHNSKDNLSQKLKIVFRPAATSPNEKRLRSRQFCGPFRQGGSARIPASRSPKYALGGCGSFRAPGYLWAHAVGRLRGGSFVTVTLCAHATDKPMRFPNTPISINRSICETENLSVVGKKKRLPFTLSPHFLSRVLDILG